MRVFRPADMGRGVRIVSTGSFLPGRVVTNADLVAAGAPLSEDEMVRLCGVRSRRWVSDGEATSDLAIGAGRAALESARRFDWRPDGRSEAPPLIDRVILGTVSPDHSSPSTACLVQHGLGLPPVPAYDVTAACSGFLYVLDAAARAVVTGDEYVLAIAADVRSKYLDVRDRATCALFGDGAGAAILGPGTPGSGLLAIGTVADGSGARSIFVPAGGSREPASADTVSGGRHTIHMQDGPQIYVSAVEGMLEVAGNLLAALGMAFKDVDLVIPHQANFHILKRLAWKAGISLDKVHVNIDRVGNISGATVALALDEALRAGKAGAGSRILLLAAGAGYTAGAAIYEVDEALLATMTGRSS